MIGGRVGARVGALGFIVPLIGFLCFVFLVGLTVVFGAGLGPKYKSGWIVASIPVVIWIVLRVCFGLRVVFLAGFPFVFGLEVVFRSNFGVVVIFGFWVVLRFGFRLVGSSVESSVASVWGFSITRAVSRVVFSAGILVVTLDLCELCTQMKNSKIDTNRK